MVVALLAGLLHGWVCFSGVLFGLVVGRPRDVGDAEDVGVVGVRDVVTEVAGVLVGAVRVAAAHNQLLAPDGAGGACGEDVVFGPEEEVGDELAADPVVPRYGAGREGAAPDVADVRDVVGVVHVHLGQQITQIGERDRVEVDACVVCTRRAVDLPAAAEGARLGGEGAQKRLLVAQLGEANKGLPVGLSESVAHVAADAGLGLCEEGAPPFDRAAAAEGFDSWAQGGDGGAALAEAEQRQRGACLHASHKKNNKRGLEMWADSCRFRDRDSLCV